MTGKDDRNREIPALRECISALGAASLRVGSSLDLDTGLPPVMADRVRIVQVLSNLLANAARCSPERSGGGQSDSRST